MTCSPQPERPRQAAEIWQASSDDALPEACHVVFPAELLHANGSDEYWNYH
jgi:hypothetical protein